ncbi:hypothetical protein [Candidatus Poriferisodalis sp.]|uniref:hypothetical protein n=1 Tax=Candidatus Poriferisodalis sp. TaxID=3101277 RepID=UPI003B5B07D9
MEQSTERILTAHVGSLPRNQAVADGIFRVEQGANVDLDTHAANPPHAHEWLR